MGGLKQRLRVVAPEPLAALELRGDRGQRRVARPGHRAARRTASVTLWPPNPKEFDSATDTACLRPVWGAEAKAHARSGQDWLMGRAKTPRCTTSAHNA